MVLVEEANAKVDLTGGEVQKDQGEELHRGEG